MKKLLLAAFLLIGLGGTSLVAQNKIGHINTQKILVLLPEREAAEKEIQKKTRELQKELEEMQAVYEQRYNEYINERDGLAQNIREIREQDLMELQQRIQERQMTAEEDLQKLQNRLMEPMIKKVEGAIKKVSEREKFNYVLDTSVLVYFDGGTDISDMVKKELDLMGEKATPNTGQK